MTTAILTCKKKINNTIKECLRENYLNTVLEVLQ